MSEQSGRSVEERLEQLEAAVRRLETIVRGLAGGLPRPPAPAAEEPAGKRPPYIPPPRPPRDRGPAASPTGTRPSFRGAIPTPHVPAVFAKGPEYWVSRIGIGLVLVGVAFLFKYAVDRGWLTPEVRVGFGVALGAVLAAIGFRVQREARWYAQLMLGGAAATWYITGFAAYQLLDVVSHATAFGFMVLVTLYAIGTGVRQDQAVLTVLGAMGGLGTPFLLYTDAQSLPRLMLYTTLLLSGTSAVYLVKGWRALLWVTAIGAWMVLMQGFPATTAADRTALQSGILTAWFLFWLVPVVRILLAERAPERWRAPEPAVPGHTDVAVLVVAFAVFGFFASQAVWNGDEGTWGWIALAVAATYAAAAGIVGRPPAAPLLGSAHGIASAILVFAGITQLLDGDARLGLVAVEAAALHLVARRFEDRPLTVAAHVLSALVALSLWDRITGAPPEAGVFNARALTDLGALALVGAAGFRSGARRWYLVIGHLTLLGWLWRELHVLPGGDGLVTVSWGIYGLGLLLFLRPARRAGLLTMGAAVAKLILFDLSQVDPLWRVLLFLGFGGVFLALGYFFRGAWDAAAGSAR